MIKAAGRILPSEDAEISKEKARLLKKRDVHIYTGTKVLPETLTKQNGSVTIQAEQEGKTMTLEAEKNSGIRRANAAKDKKRLKHPGFDESLSLPGSPHLRGARMRTFPAAREAAVRKL